MARNIAKGEYDIENLPDMDIRDELEDID